jgi:hypothetical protein
VATGQALQETFTVSVVDSAVIVVESVVMQSDRVGLQEDKLQLLCGSHSVSQK